MSKTFTWFDGKILTFTWWLNSHYLIQIKLNRVFPNLLSKISENYLVKAWLKSLKIKSWFKSQNLGFTWFKHGLFFCEGDSGGLQWSIEVCVIFILSLKKGWFLCVKVSFKLEECQIDIA